MDVQKCIRRSCSFPLSSNVQASGLLAPCMAMHGFTLVHGRSHCGLENSLRRPQEASRRPQELPRGFKTPSRPLQGASRRLQKHSKTLQDGSKSVPRGVKTAPRAFQEASRRPKSAPDCLKTGPRSLQEASKLRDGSSSLCEATRRHSKCAFKITFEEDVRRSVQSSCSFPLSSIPQAAGQLAPCILCTGSL